MRRSMLLLAVALLACAADVGPAAAGGAAEARLRNRAERAEAILEEYAAERENWQERYRTLLLAEREAEARLAQARYEHRNADKRRRLRGGKRLQLEAAITEASEALAQVRSRLESFRSQAADEGVPPGWLDAVEQEVSSPAAVD